MTFSPRIVPVKSLIRNWLITGAGHSLTNHDTRRNVAATQRISLLSRSQRTEPYDAELRFTTSLGRPMAHATFIFVRGPGDLVRSFPLCWTAIRRREPLPRRRGRLELCGSRFQRYALQP